MVFTVKPNLNKKSYFFLLLKQRTMSKEDLTSRKKEQSNIPEVKTPTDVLSPQTKDDANNSLAMPNSGLLYLNNPYFYPGYQPNQFAPQMQQIPPIQQIPLTQQMFQTQQVAHALPNTLVVPNSYGYQGYPPYGYIQPQVHIQTIQQMQQQIQQQIQQGIQQGMQQVQQQLQQIQKQIQNTTHSSTQKQTLAQKIQLIKNIQQSELYEPITKESEQDNTSEKKGEPIHEDLRYGGDFGDDSETEVDERNIKGKLFVKLGLTIKIHHNLNN
jgi:hypothetical protein